jgi:TonB family protein
MRNSVQRERSRDEEAHRPLVRRCGSLVSHGVHWRRGSNRTTPEARVRQPRREENVYRAVPIRIPIAAACLALTLAGALSARRAAAQTPSPTGAIVGSVRDSAGGMLGGAEVTVGGTALRVITDTAGRFRLLGVPLGPGTVHVRRLGYRARSVAVAVESGATASLAVALVRLPQELDPVLVEASKQPSAKYLQGFYERRSKGHGYFVTREQIAARSWSELTDVLRSLVPAVRITSSRMARNAVRLRGSRCAPLVWLDGAPAMAGEFDLDFISPETVSGVEIYPGPATVPVEFRSTRGLESCGVIVVWSRVESPEPREPRRRAQARASAADSLVRIRVYTAEEVDTAARVDSTGMSEPVYPDSLYAFRVGGEVVAQFVVDTTGQVLPETITAVSSSHPAFAEAVRRSLRRSKFRPAILAGRRVRQVMVLPYRFVMEDRRRG